MSNPRGHKVVPTLLGYLATWLCAVNVSADLHAQRAAVNFKTKRRRVNKDRHVRLFFCLVVDM